MSAFGAYRRSAVYRLVCTSATGRYFLATPSAPARMLEPSLALRAVHALRGVRALLSVAALACLAAGAIAGHPPAAAMAFVFLLSLHYPVVALGLTPALLLGAPRLPMALVGDEMLFVRLDQAAITGMLAACLLDRERPFRTPPAHTAFLLFLLALPLSMIAGVLQGTLLTPPSAALYLAQWLTWYALFVAAFNLAPRLGDRAVYAWALPLVALAAYGLAENAWPYYEEPGVRYRTFERGLFPGQANHAGGLFALATATGLAMAASSRHRLLGLAVAVAATLALLPTGSRSGLLAWAAGVSALALIYVPALRWWTPPLAALGLCAVPGALWYRFSAPGSSMHDRLVAWKSALSTVADYPVLGLGAGARHRSYYDNQYLMTLAESGFVGLLLWLAFLAALVKVLGHARARGTCPAWMAAGALATVAVLAVHGMATASFIVTLVAGPFFWFCGVALGRADGRP